MAKQKEARERYEQHNFSLMARSGHLGGCTPLRILSACMRLWFLALLPTYHLDCLAVIVRVFALSSVFALQVFVQLCDGGSDTANRYTLLLGDLLVGPVVLRSAVDGDELISAAE